MPRVFDHRSREQRKAFGVIGIVPDGRAVESVAIEVGRVVDEVVADAVLVPGGDDGAEAVLVVKGNRDTAQHGPGINQLGLAVTGKVDADLVPLGSQRTGQSTHHVGQAAGLRKGQTFRRGKSNMHEDEPPREAANTRRRI